MRTFLYNLLTVLFISCTLLANAQEVELLSEIPQEEADYKATEKNFLASVNWMENTPVFKEIEKHQEQSKLILGWIIGTPTVTLTLTELTMEFTKKNPELLVFFMGGYAKYSIENDHSTDELKCNTAGMQSLINIYKQGGLKRDKKLEKIIPIAEKGGLEDWVKEQLSEEE